MMKSLTKSIKILFLIALFAFNIAAQKERFVRPTDEAAKNASFKIFRDKLIAAVKKRDVNFIYGILDPNIKLSFGGDGGVRDFKKIWKIDDPKSRFWNEFGTIIRNGGFFSDAKTFSAPYSFDGFPEDLDAFEHSIIFGNNVNLRAEPNLSAKTVSKLSYNVVKVDFENSIPIKNSDGDYSWLKVETLGGQKGFVNAEYVRSPIDLRAIFENQKGKWKLTALIAGD